MAKNTKTYQDFDMNFGKNSYNGDVNLKIDDEAIKASIRNLILTSHYEIPFHSELGSNIRRILFEPVTPLVNGMIKREIINLITTYEPRASIVDIIITYMPDNNMINLNIVFAINGTSIITQTQIVLEKTR